MANRRLRNRPPSFFRSLLKGFLVLGFGFGMFLLGLGLALIQGYSLLGKFLPQMTQTLKSHRTQLRSVAFDQNNDPIAEFYLEKRDWTPLSRISPNFVNCLLGFEDIRFESRYAVDPLGIARAIVENLRRGDFGQGGSTITQQLARNILRDHQHSFERKIKEIFLAIAIENAYTKNQVVELYANEVYFGKGRYGVEVASQDYFGKSAADISLAEAAYLVSLLKNPNAYSRDKALGKVRRDIVLKKLLRERYHFRREQLQQALGQPLVFAPPPPPATRKAPYFSEYVRLSLQDRYGLDLYKKGLRIMTTLDPHMQAKAEEGFEEGLQIIEKIVFRRINVLPKAERLRYYLKTPNFDPKNPRYVPKPLQGGLVLLQARTGHIKALVGGRNFDQNQFNRATSAYRQPGSTFKAMIYTTAFNEGVLTPEDRISDSPGNWGGWSPGNYGGGYKGVMSVMDAIAQSRNLPAVRALDKVGVSAVTDSAYKMGFRGPFTRNLTMALGASEVSPLEMAGLFGAIAAGGTYVQPTAVSRLENPDGKVLERVVFPQRRVFSTQAAQQMIRCLEKAANAGTGTRIRRLIGYKGYLAGKTGTTNGFTDAWFDGIFQYPDPTPDYEYDPHTPYPLPLANPMIAVMYVGFDQKLSMGHGLAGGRVVAPIVGYIMKKIQGQPIEPLVIP